MFSKISILAINRNSGSFARALPPQDVRKSDGKVPIPKKTIPSAARAGLEKLPEIKRADYSNPQGIKPRITPSKYPFNPRGF